jgi:glycosyltransferase involved in cell wall biosynthesis
MLIQDLGLDPERVVSVPTGVDSTLYKPVTKAEKKMLREKLGIPKDKLIVGTVATLRLLKGIEYLFDAIRLLNNTQCLLYVVGDGPQRARLESWILEHGMERQIAMVGEQRNVHEWLQSFDIFAFPSLAEGVPQALAQAMLTELPCVTTNVGGIPELAIDQVTALVCDPRNEAEIEKRLRQMISRPLIAKVLAKNARTHCEKGLSLARMCTAMEHHFQLCKSIAEHNH